MGKTKIKHINIKAKNINFINCTFIAFVAVFLSRYAIIPFDHYNISVANYLWLPTGASILAILLFGYRAFFGVLAGYLVAALIIKGGFDMTYINSYLGKVIDSLAPIIAIWAMRSVNFGNFFTDGKTNYIHILALIVLTVLIATAGKLIVYPMNGKIIDDWAWFMQSYSISGILGGIVFITAILAIFKPILIKNNII